MFSSSFFSFVFIFFSPSLAFPSHTKGLLYRILKEIQRLLDTKRSTDKADQANTLDSGEVAGSSSLDGYGTMDHPLAIVSLSTTLIYTSPLQSVLYFIPPGDIRTMNSELGSEMRMVARRGVLGRSSASAAVPGCVSIRNTTQTQLSIVNRGEYC